MSFWIKSLIRTKKNPKFFPFYHTIQEKPKPHLKHLYQPKTKDEFVHDLKIIQRYFLAVSLSEILDGNHTSPIFHLTFDDGFTEVFEIADVLLDLKIPATFFLNPYFIDNQSLMFRSKQSVLIEAFLTANPKKQKRFLDFFQTKRLKLLPYQILSITYQNQEKLNELAQLINFSFSDYLVEHKPYLTQAQILKMQQEGFTFGAHTLDHPNLKTLNKDMQEKQIFSSIELVQKKIELNYKCFSFPFSEDGISKDLMQSISNEIDLSFGSKYLNESGFYNHFSRVNLEDFVDFQEKTLAKLYAKDLVKRFLKKNLIEWT